MKGNWSKLLVRVTGWLLLELSLEAVGLDTLADYSEYVFTTKETVEQKVEEKTFSRRDGFLVRHPILSIS